MSDISEHSTNRSVGTYQHDLIQASLLYEWKLQSKQTATDGYYNIAVAREHVDQPRPVRALYTPLQPTTVRPPFRIPRVRLVIAVAAAIACTAVVLDNLRHALGRFRGHEENTWSSNASVASTELPVHVRPADYEAFDRIAMMLPSHWLDWLSNPPYINVDLEWPTPSSASLRQAHDTLNRLITSNTIYHLDTNALLERLRHANGWPEDSNDEQFASEILLDGRRLAWLHDAGHCYVTYPAVYCRLRHPYLVAQVQSTLLNPWEALLAYELDYLRHAHALLRLLGRLSSQQLSDFPLSLEDLLAESARQSLPFPPPPPPTPGSNILPHGLDPTKLATYYQHFAYVAFLELSSHTLQPEFQARIDRLERFQQKLHTQRQCLQNDHPAIVVPAFHREAVDWVANDAAYTLRTRTFVNATRMRHNACTWSLERLPVLDDDQRNPEAAHSSLHHAVSFISTPQHAQDVQLDALRAARVHHYNILADALWFSPNGLPSVRWHWNEGGSWTWTWEGRVEEQWRERITQQVQDVMKVLAKDYQRPGVGGERTEKEVQGMEDGKLLPLASRRDAAELLWRWPRLTSRMDCKIRYQGRDGDGGEALP
ncbi:uncharacterized protein CLAFUR5_14642 [Fulvia fulva]|uniref:Uncharacterized protein n=1 Tax=Passalora fulva TaxID=5499 RepID=A0A9Q8PMX0_PASFU|nr:uncharacterized protein CLAFUR5_14642 [Fulvia fulva]KAK4608883.1 hypothetical protein CLAFUR0_14852 [Fulvia fulva]UJO25428.1 hypothetical protein CLAFUR5_14642 [Fulvia fulva]